MDYPKIQFEAGFPEELKDKFTTSLDKVKWLCPLWMQVVHVHWVDTSEWMAQWRLHKDYRVADLDLCGGFLSITEWEQHEVLIHEIIHSYTIPLKTVIQDVMIDLKTSDEITTIISRQVNKVMEQVTQDFAFAIARKQG